MGVCFILTPLPRRKSRGIVCGAVLALCGLSLCDSGAIAGKGANRIAVDTLTDVLDGDVSSIQALLNNPGADGAVSLREAILAANGTPGPDRIVFRVSGTIEVLTPLPALDDLTGGTEIDGRGLITLDGLSLEAWQYADPIIPPEFLQHGLVIMSPGNTIADLTIIRFPGEALRVQGPFGNNNTIKGCFIGTDGYTDLGNYGPGLHILEGASGNTVGGRTPDARNIISGNMMGVAISGDASQNRVIGNFIGVDVTGQFAIPNYFLIVHTPDFVTVASYGVLICTGSSRNVIGGMGEEGNLISANHNYGVSIGDQNTEANRIQGNSFIEDYRPGVPLDPWLRMSCVDISGSPRNIVGGAAPGEGNVFTVSSPSAVAIALTQAVGNVVQGNEIPAPSDFMQDRHPAIRVQVGASGNLIGGVAPGAGNRIHGRHSHGVETVPYNPVRGNSISGSGGKPYNIQSVWLPHLPPPEITGANPIRGTSPPCTSVDLYLDVEDEGKVYVGAVEADGCGNFALAADLGSYHGWNITATATSRIGSTSMYSAAFPITGLPDMLADTPPTDQDCACTGEPHTADRDADNRIDLSELLLVVQLYQADGFRCSSIDDDYYVPGSGNNWTRPPDGGNDMVFCTPHDADYFPRNWSISLGELMRVVQLYNFGGYHQSPQGEDGFCPGAR